MKLLLEDMTVAAVWLWIPVGLFVFWRWLVPWTVTAVWP